VIFFFAFAFIKPVLMYSFSSEPCKANY